MPTRKTNSQVATYLKQWIGLISHILSRRDENEKERWGVGQREAAPGKQPVHPRLERQSTEFPGTQLYVMIGSLT